MLIPFLGISLSLIATNAFPLEKRQDNINEPLKFFQNKTFLIVAGSTCVGLFLIFGPLIGIYCYTKRKAQLEDDQDDINTVFKSVDEENPASQRKPRVTSMISNDPNRMSMISGAGSGFNYVFPSSQQDNANNQVPKVAQTGTYSTVFRDSFMTDLGVDSSIDTVIPPPFNKIKLDQTYLIVRAYKATEFDEMSVREGDVIVVHKVYEDGWVLGMNYDNKNQGVIPSDCFDF
jgi:hypothetical protein